MKRVFDGVGMVKKEGIRDKDHWVLGTTEHLPHVKALCEVIGILGFKGYKDNSIWQEGILGMRLSNTRKQKMMCLSLHSPTGEKWVLVY